MENEVLTFKDLPGEAYEVSAILQHVMAYELIDFLARLQVVAAAHMAQDHANQQVNQRALDSEPVSDDEPKLQNVGHKWATKKRRTHIELPELNMTLVETYRELDKTMHAAKDMVANS